VRKHRDATAPAVLPAGPGPRRRKVTQTGAGTLITVLARPDRPPIRASISDQLQRRHGQTAAGCHTCSTLRFAVAHTLAVEHAHSDRRERVTSGGVQPLRNEREDVETRPAQPGRRPPAVPEEGAQRSASQETRVSADHTPPGAKPIDPERLDGKVLGSYRVVRIIGRGGMGYVYRAEHVKLGRPVALKLLRSDYAARRDAVARFFHEARAVNRIRHRNIVDVTDFVELDSGVTFIVMELLEGVSLGTLIQASQRLEGCRALRILQQICDGLAAAHAVGIVHRDLKPDNIIVLPGPDGSESGSGDPDAPGRDRVKLLDFGVAKLLPGSGEDVPFQTVAGAVIGTPAYMSPEQAGALPIDHRSDIYSLGAIMYELFTGRPVFEAQSFGEFVRRHLNDTPVPPRHTSGGHDMDPRLESIILRCLNKRPEDRYQSAGELRQELNALLQALEQGGDTQTRRRFRLPALLSPLASASLPRLPLPAASPSPAGHEPGRVEAAARPPEARLLPGLLLPQRLLLGAGLLLMVIVGLAVSLPERSAGRGHRAPVGSHLARKRAAPVPTVTPMEASALRLEGGRRTAGTARPDAPTPDVRPLRELRVHIESTPPGDVFAAGAATPTCRTPCDVLLETTDTGPKRRYYFVRRPGYHVEPVVIDLSSPPVLRQISLRPATTATAGRVSRGQR
jgi:serine/threonine protein kinase